MSTPAVMQSFFEQSPSVLLVVRADADFTIVAVSDPYLRVSHTTREQIYGRPLFEVFPDDPNDPHANGVASLRASFARVIATRAPDTMPLVRYDIPRSESAGGGFEERYWRAVNAPVIEPDGSVGYLQQQVEDVTESVRLEAARRDADARAEADRQHLRDVFMQAPTAIAIMKGPRYVIELVNARICRLWGRTREQVLGKPLFDALPEAAGQGFEARLDGVLATGVPFVGRELPVRLARLEGGGIEEVYFDFVYEPVRDADGAVNGVTVVATDVTTAVRERRQIEAAAATRDREHERRLNDVLEASGTGTWELDVRTGRMTTDARFVALVGLPAGTVVTREIAVGAADPDDRARVDQAVNAALAGENGGRYAIEHRTAPRGDAPERWIEVRGRVEFDETGEAVRLGGTAVDVTARKAAEREREALLAREATARAEAERLAAELEAIIESAPDAIMVGDAEHLSRLNQRALELFGHTSRESFPTVLEVRAREVRYRDIESSEPLPLERNAMFRALHGERATTDVAFDRHGDGATVYARLHAAPVTLDGRTTGAVVIATDITEQRRQDTERDRLLREVQAARRRLASLVENAPAFVATLRGPRHVYELTNPPLLRLLGAERPLVGRSVEEALPELVEQGFVALLDRVYTTGEPFVGNEIHAALDRRGNGTLEDAYMNFVYQPARNAQGEIDGVDCFGFDVTDQVRARHRVEALAAEVSASETQLRNVTDAIPLLVSHVTADGRYGFVNRAYEDWFGVSHGEILGRTVREVIGESAWAQLGPFVTRAIAGERMTFEQHGVAYRFGGLRDVKATFVPYVRSDGGSDGYVALLRDITVERRLAVEREALLRRVESQETLLAAILEQMPAGIIVCEAPSLRTLFSNAGLERILHHPVVPARTLADWSGYRAFHRDDGAAYAPEELPLIRAVTTGEIVGDEEIEYERPDGSRIVIRCSAAPVRNRHGEVTAGVVLFTDITEKYRLETERVALLREAERARQQAESANELKDQFLATVSHELRTPLNAMLGWLRLLRAGQVKPEQRERTLETIERNARAQSQLIEDLLDVSRIVAGKLRIESEPTDLGPVVEAALEVVLPAAHAKGVTLACAMEPEPMVVSGDGPRLQQVVWNLVSNAVKFTPRGGRVDVAVTRGEDHVEITVSDTGEGIAPEFVPHVFERFRQADGATGRAHGGLGLGLTIVKNLVDLHGGTIGVHSAGIGLGAKFTVQLPVIARRSAVPERPSVEIAPEVHAIDYPAEIDGLRVLVLEDDDDARDVLTAIFEGGGATVVATSTIADAMRELVAIRPDVVVSDIGLKGEDGYMFARGVRALAGDGWRRLPLVALTAYARSEDRSRALRAGFTTHVPKPIDANEILAVVASLVVHRRG